MGTLYSTDLLNQEVTQAAPKCSRILAKTFTLSRSRKSHARTHTEDFILNFGHTINSKIPIQTFRNANMPEK
jgi:hypothetical protein